MHTKTITPKLLCSLPKKLLCTLAFVFASTSFECQAENAMRSIFNGMVAQTDPQTFTTATRLGAVGGSFSYRQPSVNTNLISMSFPKASAGCNGVDVFLGSFSLINGDQLVQIARGIAQGAAIYAFNVAVSAICADCAATINDIQNKLAAYNKFAKDSCNATYSFLASPAGLGSPESYSGSVSSGPGALLSTVNGILPDFGQALNSTPSEINKKNYAHDPDLFKEKFSGNIIYMGFMNTEGGTLNIGGVTELSGYRLSEQIMSLIGTVIVSWDSNGENASIKRAAPTLSVEDYIYGNSSDTAKFLRCAPTPNPASSKKAQCLELKETVEGFQGLQKTIEDVLLSAQRQVLSNTKIGEEELRMIQALGLSNIVQSLNILTASEGHQYIMDISSIAATDFTINTLSSVSRKLMNMQADSDSLSSLREDTNRLMDSLDGQIKFAYQVQRNRKGDTKDVIRYWDDALRKSMLMRDSGMR